MSGNRGQLDRLPDDVADMMRVMAGNRDPRLSHWMAWMRRQNWTAGQVAEPLGLTRQAVSQRVAKWLDAHGGELPGSPPVGLPRVPYQRPRPKVSAVRTYTLPVADIATLAGLWMMSSRVRNTTAEGHPNLQASALFDAKVGELVRAGYSLGQIAHDIGVEERLIRLRLSRHGLTVADLRRGA